MRIILITGMSGAGKSTALDALEDMGIEAIDNTPLTLLPMIIEPLSDTHSGRKRPNAVALGVDVRSRDFSTTDLLQLVEDLRSAPETELSLVFLDCQDDVLAGRFSETRRRHPLALDRPVSDGIAEERALITPLKDHADMVLDTSTFKKAELRQAIRSNFGTDEQGLSVCVMSFSYARGLPRNADIVLDVRFLKNPHYVPELMDKTGLDDAVGDYIKQDAEFEPFWTQIRDLLQRLLPRYAAEGKSYLTIAFGCTGGKHRSVFLTEQCASWLEESGYQLIVQHRDIPVAITAV